MLIGNSAYPTMIHTMATAPSHRPTMAHTTTRGRRLTVTLCIARIQEPSVIELIIV